MLLASGLSVEAKKKNVLFIGNSYIYTNNVPGILQQICVAKGDTLTYGQHTPGGCTLQTHASDATTLSTIKSDNWDVVLIQEQSQRPAFSQTQVETYTYPYAKALYDTIKKRNSCSEVMFMMTWGYKNGDASNCAAYPPICTYAGMQDGLRTSYMRMAKDNNANVAPVGMAWKTVRDSFPGIELYSPDNSHPSTAGSYLEACVLYASIYHKSPVGANYTAGLTVADAAKLQRIAAQVTLDSLEQWQQYGIMSFAKFVITPGVANSFTFQNYSKRTSAYLWNFGDGTTSSAAIPPAKTYTVKGNYPIILTASNACNGETTSDTIKIKTVGLDDVDGVSPAFAYRADNGKTYIQWGGSNQYSRMMVYDMSGRTIATYSIETSMQKVMVDVMPGSYVFMLIGKNGEQSIKGRFIQY